MKLFSTETTLIWLDLQHPGGPACALRVSGHPVVPPHLQHTPTPHAAGKRPRGGIQRPGELPGVAAADAGGLGEAAAGSSGGLSLIHI